MGDVLLKVEGLEVFYTRGRQRFQAVRDVAFEVGAGETFGLIGGSGCGKSTILLVLSGLDAQWRGTVTLGDQTRRDGEKAKAAYSGQVQMVFQDPYGSLHPRHTIDRTLSEPLKVHGVQDVEQRVLEVLNALAAIFFVLVGLLMRAAPVGAFGAFAFTIGKYGIGSVTSLAELVATVYLTSAAFVFGVLGLVGWACGFSILKLVRYLREELLLVLGTSSSESALPSLLAKLERAGASKSVVGLVVPTGYSFNLDGTNLYMTMAALFIAQALGIHLGLKEQAILLAVAMVSSKGAAGVSGAGFITLAATLSVVPSVPIAGMTLILGVDRFMSECRSLTNFVGNAVATLVIARWEGALDVERLQAALDGRLPTDPRPVASDPAVNPAPLGD